MRTKHPSWCLGTEPDDRVSQTVRAAGPQEPTDILLRLTQPAFAVAADTHWTSLEMKFVEEATP